MTRAPLFCISVHHQTGRMLVHVVIKLYTSNCQYIHLSVAVYQTAIDTHLINLTASCVCCCRSTRTGRTTTWRRRVTSGTSATCRWTCVMACCWQTSSRPSVSTTLTFTLHIQYIYRHCYLCIQCLAIFPDLVFVIILKRFLVFLEI